MKTIFTLLASLFLGVAVFAADAKPKSMLTIRSVDNADIRVVIDGRRFEPNGNAMMIRDLESGRHNIKVYRSRSTGRINIFGARYELVYNNNLTVRPKTHTRISIDRNGRTSIDERRIAGNSNGRGNRDRDIDWEGDRDFNYDRDGQWGDYDDNNGYDRGMDDREFSRVLQSIEKEWLESNKIKSAIQIVKTNSVTSAQVRQMMQLFGFENNKLELAKQSYANTVDKRNFGVVNDLFSFSSSKEDLARYIRNFR